MLNQFVNETGVTIILVHRLRKMKAEDSFEEISGTTGLTGAVDGLFVMKKVTSLSHEAKFIATGRDIESFELKLKFNLDNHRWKLIEKSLEDIVEDDCIFNVIQLINETQFFEGTSTELSELLQIKFNYSIHPSALSKKIRKNESLLFDYHIHFKSIRTSYRKTMILVLHDGSDGNDG